ncbi:MAG: hypothetical protein HN856_09615 [Gammaproteobacteria bacterium]|jgi:1-acyl-sn-glycerol-3-phosphate acyltransferase|nr:hypothetical protein [Gammaproteobacteria bacterium]MCH1551757.1 1-acyl-sn-glycerol-3-phosphate acyltransferase [Pseudomonadales bacterium]
MIQRRILSIGALALITLSVFAISPVLLLLAAVLSRSKRFCTLPHALLFALGFLLWESCGVLRLFWAWLRYRKHPNYLDYNQRIQYWWANGLLQLGISIYKLDIVITGQAAIYGPTALVAARHTSIGDTVLPMMYFAKTRNEGMRYILKQELTVMPCLDIAGHRLPNLFVDRSGVDTEAELNAVRQLTRQASERENIMVYPEGTRFTPQKASRLKRTKPELSDQLARWPDLLPPRLGGFSAMLDANPGKDMVFLAHTGFEGSASPTDLINGSWRHQKVRLHFWRVPFADIPIDRKAFLFAQWDEMQRQVKLLLA